MLKVVTDEAAITRCRRQFVRSFKPVVTERLPVKLGHPGASEKVKVAWSESLGIWFFTRKIAGSRYWNGFGIGRPETGAAIAITCEINFPFCGIDRRIGGAFAQDRVGRLFVVHRGKLGGGRKGIGKLLFETHYRGAWEVMDDGGEETPVAIIGILQSPRFARQIAEFVRTVASIKETAAARSSQAELTFGELRLREELIGARYREQERLTGAECDHGLIVRDLADALKGDGLRTGNDGCRDLMAINREGKIRAVFQILTEISQAAIHAGATQLLLNGLSLPGNPLLFLAIPHAPEAALREKLKRLNIDLLIYNWQGDRALFPELAPLLPTIAS